MKKWLAFTKPWQNWKSFLVFIVTGEKPSYCQHFYKIIQNYIEKVMISVSWVLISRLGVNVIQKNLERNWIYQSPIN
ncbi:hypothetical protein COO09_12210 [Rhizorhabdus dicambivorans]|uniref:Uncharacterized protein n=1 Tax=Rhizorhabdus dicambivorans TaxID=1850238 RepID=A0A2A4FX86_9SPHN|nr:hypothetical protein CMV14_18505 [Rhizorhabdus dicambivorans]PCE42073.1 hypothetical protein COO09_12210 [Rhizorhabdus dicambivorans]